MDARKKRDGVFEGVGAIRNASGNALQVKAEAGSSTGQESRSPDASRRRRSMTESRDGWRKTIGWSCCPGEVTASTDANKAESS